MAGKIDNLRAVISEWVIHEDIKTIERDIKLPVDSNKVITVIGPRRAGKTFLLYRTISKISKSIPKNNILYINFEDERLIKSKLKI